MGVEAEGDTCWRIDLNCGTFNTASMQLKDAAPGVNAAFALKRWMERVQR
jgi:hypothetical protein